MIAMIGAVLEILGLLSGLILVLAPFGIGPATPGVITWIMFPTLTLAGYLVLGTASGQGRFSLLSKVAGGALLLLAVASVVALFLAANNLAGQSESHASLWYVAVIGFILGGMSFSLGGKSTETRAQPPAA
jgi:hypothetical protein